jgi:hypothetical protein
MSSHTDSAVAMLRLLPDEYRALANRFAQAEQFLSTPQTLTIAACDYLIHCRCVLDYLAHELIRLCNAAPKRVYFPVIRPPGRTAEFSLQMKKWFPGLEGNHPQVYAALDYWQYYNSNDWLIGFVEITNDAKHVQLALHERANCQAITIRHVDCPNGLQLGEAGLGAMVLDDRGGTLRFPLRSGSFADIRGPQVLDKNTRHPVNADPGFIITEHNWQELKFSGYLSQPAVTFLKVVGVHVKQIAGSLAPHLGFLMPVDLPEFPPGLERL